MSIRIVFRGVRGSVASPGRETAGVGGNTSCVEVVAGGQRIVFDAGTGLRSLGQELVAAGPSETTLLLSHLHWDHIQGLPFFAPLYAPGHVVHVLSGPNDLMSLDDALRRQMSPPFFPVSFDRVARQLRVREVAVGEPFAVGGGVRVTAARLNHPDPVFGFRVECGERAVVYATDTEHFSCVDPGLRALAEGADVLIYDAQYTPEEYRGDGGGPARVGWGHSTFAAGAALAHAAGVGELVLFHHDPERTDAEVRGMEVRAQRLFDATRAAREGMVIDFAGPEAPGDRDGDPDPGPGQSPAEEAA